jgi:fibronectin type III domain protein
MPTDPSNKTTMPDVIRARQWLVLGCLIALLAGASRAGAGVRQITSNAVPDGPPRINARGQMVWVREQGYFEQIDLWDGTSVRQLSHEMAKNGFPQLNDAGEVVWLGWQSDDAPDSVIYRWDGTALWSIRRDTRSVNDLQINNRGQVLWSEFDGRARQIYLWEQERSDAAGGIRPLTFGPVEHDNPFLGPTGDIAWQGFGPDSWQVYLWQEGSIRQISHQSPDVNGGFLFYPQVNSFGQAAWRALDRGFFTFFWNGATTRTLNPIGGSGSDGLPQLSDRGWIVWATVAGEILLWDGSSVRLISPPGVPGALPQINAAGQVVWQSGSDLFLWEEGQVRRITDDRSAGRNEPHFPQINVGGQVGWTASDGHDTEIFLYTPSRPGSVELADGSVVEGSPSVGTVYLPAPAPAGGAVVTLASSQPGVVSVPDSVLVPAGAGSADFPVRTGLVEAATVAEISAAYGSESWKTTLQVTHTSLSELALSYYGVGGVSFQGQLYLDGAAPPEGAGVQLTSDNPDLARVPTTVTVPPGTDRVTFTLTTGTVTAPTPIEIRATYRGVTRQARITLTDGFRLGLTIKYDQVKGGATSEGYVTIERPDPNVPTVVRLTTDRPDIVTVPASVSVPPREKYGEFEIQTRPVAVTTGALVTASVGSEQASAPLTVVGQGLTALTFEANPVTGGAETTGRVLLGDPAPARGFDVWLQPSDYNLFRAFPQKVTVPPGGTAVNFPVQTVPVSGDREVTVSATDGAGKVSAVLRVTANQLVSLALSAPQAVGGDPVTAKVILRSPAPAGGAMVQLTSDDVAAAVPPAVVIPAGTTSALVPVTTRAVTAATPVFLTASYGAMTRSTDLLVLPPTPLSLTLDPDRISGGMAVTATVVLSDPAPAGGAVVLLHSQGPATAPVPDRLVVPAGMTTVAFSLRTQMVAAATVSLITAEYAGFPSAAPLTVLPIPPGPVESTTRLSLGANDIVFDPTSGRIYASIAAPAGRRGNSLVWIDPYSGAVGPAVPVGPEPGLLALSDPRRYLYVALDGSGSVRRFDLAAAGPDPGAGLEFSLGQDVSGGRFSVIDMKGVPGAPDSVAVVRVHSREFPTDPEVLVFDGGLARQFSVSQSYPSHSIAFSKRPDLLYGLEDNGRSSALRRMILDPTGVMLRELKPEPIPGRSVGMVLDEGRIYTPSGYMVDPEARQVVGQIPGLPEPPADRRWFDPPALVAADSSVGRVFYLTDDGGSYTLRAFDEQTLQPLGTLPVDGVQGIPTRLIRWSADGLAIRTSDGQVLLIRTSLVPRVDARVTLDTALVVGGQPVQAQVRLNGPAPAGGAIVPLRSSDPRAATVPAEVVVPAGETAATFRVSTVPVEADTLLTLQAGRAGEAGQADLQVLAPPLVELTIEPPVYDGSGRVTGTVRLGGAAPAAGAVVTLESSDLIDLAVPESVTVPGGSTRATFVIEPRRPELRQFYTVKASRGGIVRQASINVRGFVPQSLVIIPSWLRGSGTATGVLTLEEPAPAGGARVRLYTPPLQTLTGKEQIPESVTVAAGERSALFPILILPMTYDNGVTVCAGWRSDGPCATLDILMPMPVTVRFTPEKVLGGDTCVATITLPEPAPAGGVTFFLNTGYMSVLDVSRTVTVPAGSRSVSLTVGTRPVQNRRLESLWPTGPANAEVALLTVLPRGGLQPPGDLSAHPLSPTRVRLDWTDTSTSETGFGVWRRSSGDWVRIGVAPQDSPTFVDAGAQPDTTYTYRVRAHNNYGASAWSSEVTVQTPGP